jgi:hypothetical protein
MCRELTRYGSPGWPGPRVRDNTNRRRRALYSGRFSLRSRYPRQPGGCAPARSACDRARKTTFACPSCLNDPTPALCTQRPALRNSASGLAGQVSGQILTLGWRSDGAAASLGRHGARSFCAGPNLTVGEGALLLALWLPPQLILRLSREACEGAWRPPSFLIQQPVFVIVRPLAARSHHSSMLVRCLSNDWSYFEPF